MLRTMQEYEWVKMNPNGTVEIDISTDADSAVWVTIPRVAIKHIRKFGLMLEDADDLMTDRNRIIRGQVGLTDQIATSLNMLNGTGEPTAEMLLSAPDLMDVQNAYHTMLSRFLFSDENPYPKVWAEIINEFAGEHVIDGGDLPAWALGQPALQMLLNHWQTVPLALGTQPVPEP